MFTRALAAFALLVLSACAQLPPHPQDAVAKKFEAVPGKSVIYLVRPHPELAPSQLAMTVQLDDMMMGSTYSGTYFRWEVEPGRHELRGYGMDNARLTIDTAPGQIYFVRQDVYGNIRSAWSAFKVIDPEAGRALVARSDIIPGR